MKITRDVVADLWPAYESGEASADTRALVEAFLKDDPDLGRILGGEGEPALPATTPGPRPDADKKVLVAAQRMIRRRKWLQGLALFFTMLPMTSVYTDRLRFVLWRDLPALAVASLLTAAALWAAYVAAGQRLKIRGF